MIVTNKKRNIVFIFFLALSLITATLIFTLSHQDATQSVETSMGVTSVLVDAVTDIIDDFTDAPKEEIVVVLDGYIRILGHFFGFFILSFFVSGSVFSSRLGYKKSKKVGLAVLITLAYAILDEIHQYFIPGRAFQISDILTDLAGAIFGALTFLGGFLLFKKIFLKIK